GTCRSGTPRRSRTAGRRTGTSSSRSTGGATPVRERGGGRPRGSPCARCSPWGAPPSARRGKLEQLRQPPGADVVGLEVGGGRREARRHHVARHLDQDDPEA